MAKQVIVVRNDLKMRKGKLAAQVAHASMKVLLDQGHWTDKDSFELTGLLSPMVAWMNNKFTKVVVKCDSEEELLDVYHRAQAKGIPSSLIQDNGDTEFGGKKTYTSVAVGPEDSHVVDQITKDFSLL
jgi:PTH2 family peptidyl-tRNA hydrolase